MNGSSCAWDGLMKESGDDVGNGNESDDGVGNGNESDGDVENGNVSDCAFSYCPVEICSVCKGDTNFKHSRVDKLASYRDRYIFKFFKN